MRALIAIARRLLSGVPAAAGTLTLAPTPITEWKAVYRPRREPGHRAGAGAHRRHRR